MERYLSDHRGTNSTAWDIAKVCENPLGFHLFLKYVDNRGLEVLADFIRACAVYRNLTHGMRLQSGIEIAVTYLLCKYPVEVSSKWPSTLARKLHHEISLDATSFFDAMESANCVCVRGAPYEQVLHSIERAMSRMEMESVLSSNISVVSGHSQVSNITEDIQMLPRRSNRVSGKFFFLSHDFVDHQPLSDISK